jgi:hypothetical protein
MEENLIKAYFERQLRQVIERASVEPESFLSYFFDHYPRDEEILGLLAVSCLPDIELHSGESFPTPVEALAALTVESRTEICTNFREELRQRFRAMTPA